MTKSLIDSLMHLESNEVRKVVAQGHLRLFGDYVTPSWDWSPKHIKLIADKLMAVERGEIKRLMIFLPPRHSKSETGTIHFPAWFMMRNPEKRVIVTSYSSELAKTFSRRTRSIVREFGEELFNVQLSDESQSVEQWSLQGHHGMYIAAGVGSGITGQGASLLVIDDPVKSAEEANSPTYRQRVWDWYTSTAYTRLEPDGAVVLTLTRWHEDDLAGRLLAQMESTGEAWEVIRLPALAEDEGDPLGRAIGEPLWPERYGEKEFERIQKAVGSYVWTALYQQRPQAIEGGAFKAKWFQWYTKNEVSFNEQEERWYFRDEPLRIFQGVDPAISSKTSADDFVVFTIGVTPTSKIVLIDPYADHLEFTEQSPMLVRKFQEWGAELMGIETNAFQMALKQQIVKDAVIAVKGLHHSGDKYTRIMSMSPFFENGQVYCRQALDNEEGWIDAVRLPGVRIHAKFRKFYEQAVTYGATAAHDDLLDGLENAISLCKLKYVPNAHYQ